MGEKGESFDSFAGLGKSFINVILMGRFVNYIAALLFHCNGHSYDQTGFIQ